MKKAIVIVVLGFAIQAYAQEEVGSINTDRPVQSETPTVVPKKYLQGEFGGVYERGNEFGNFRSDNTYAPNILIKYGLIKNMELRFATDYLTSSTIANIQGKEKEESESSLTDPLLGIKYSFLQQKEHGINLTVSLQSQIGAWASEAFRQEEENWQGRLTTGFNFTDNWYVLAGVGYYWYEASNSNLFYVFQTGYSFGQVTALVEYYSNKYDNFEQSAVNGALVVLLNDNNQADISFGKGLDDNFYDYYISLGYSLRLGF